MNNTTSLHGYITYKYVGNHLVPVLVDASGYIIVIAYKIQEIILNNSDSKLSFKYMITDGISTESILSKGSTPMLSNSKIDIYFDKYDIDYGEYNDTDYVNTMVLGDLDLCKVLSDNNGHFMHLCISL